MAVVSELEPPEGASGVSPAPPLYRLLAFAVDALVIGITLLLPAVVVGMLAGLSLFLLIVVFAATLVTYLAVSVWLTGGLTLGKAVFGLEVRRIDGNPPARTLRGLLWSVGRHSAGYLVIDVFGLGSAVALNRRRRCLHDYAFGSEVLTSAATGDATLRQRRDDYLQRLEDALNATGRQYGRMFSLWKRMAKIVMLPATVVAILAGKLTESTGGKVWAFLHEHIPGLTPRKETQVQQAAQPLSTKSTVALWAGTTAVTGIIVLLVVNQIGPPAPTDVNVVFANETIGQPNTSEIHLMKADGSRPRRLTSNHVEDRWPDLLDDRRIVFARKRDDNFDLYVMNADGKNERRLTRSPANDLQPRWSEDGERIAFVSDRSGDHEIYVMDADGTDVRRVMTDDADDSEPVWSPDGEKIAFVSDRTGNREIYVMDRDGTDVRRVMTDDADDSEPVWSPDGERIAFVSDRDGDPEIYLMDADGTNLRRLTRHEANENSPRWTPDGNYVLFESDRGLTGGGEEIYAVGVNGGPARRLTTWNVS